MARLEIAITKLLFDFDKVDLSTSGTAELLFGSSSLELSCASWLAAIAVTFELFSTAGSSTAASLILLLPEWSFSLSASIEVPISDAALALPSSSLELSCANWLVAAAAAGVFCTEFLLSVSLVSNELSASSLSELLPSLTKRQRFWTKKKAMSWRPENVHIPVLICLC